MISVLKLDELKGMLQGGAKSQAFNFRGSVYNFGAWRKIFCVTMFSRKLSKICPESGKYDGLPKIKCLFSRQFLNNYLLGNLSYFYVPEIFLGFFEFTQRVHC